MSDDSEAGDATHEKAERKRLFKPSALREYVFEFLMIFLAVFLGFWAETFRENLSDRTREREYIRSLIRNLQDDERKLSVLIKANENKLNYLDTVRALGKTILETPEYKIKLNNAVSHGICCVHFFKSNDATMSELKYGGGLTLFPRNVVDSVLAYDASLYDILKEEAQYENNGMRAIDFFLTITDDWWIWDSSLTASQGDLKRVFNYANNVKSSVAHYKYLLIVQKSKARNLINFLNKEYEL